MKPSKREAEQINFLTRRGYRVVRVLVRRKRVRPLVAYNIHPPSFHNLLHVAE